MEKFLLEIFSTGGSGGGFVPQFLIRYAHKNCWTQLAIFCARKAQKISLRCSNPSRKQSSLLARFREQNMRPQGTLFCIRGSGGI